MRTYFSFTYLEIYLKKANSLISRALIKHGYYNFSLVILEYSDQSEGKSSLLAREQYYLDLLNPYYNILRTAGSCLGIKRSKKTFAKLRIVGLHPENLKRLKKYPSNPDNMAKFISAQKEWLLKYNQSKSQKVEVLNTLTNEITIQPSIGEAGIFIGCTDANVRSALKYLKDKGGIKAYKKISKVKLYIKD
jgi:group I intron endonuclease